MFTEYDYKYFIKITKKEKEVVDGMLAVIVIDKIVCTSKHNLKNKLKTLRKYENSKYKILTYQNIRRRWYECPRPK